MKSFSDWLKTREGLLNAVLEQTSEGAQLHEIPEWQQYCDLMEIEREASYVRGCEVAADLGLMPIDPAYRSVVNDYMMTQGFSPISWHYVAGCDKCGPILVDKKLEGKQFAANTCPWCTYLVINEESFYV